MFNQNYIITILLLFVTDHVKQIYHNYSMHYKHTIVTYVLIFRKKTIEYTLNRSSNLRFFFSKNSILIKIKYVVFLYDKRTMTNN